MKLSLIDIRENLRLTKKQAAQRIGVSENLLEKWEKGEIKPDLVEGKKISITYGILADHIKW